MNQNCNGKNPSRDISVKLEMSFFLCGGSHVQSSFLPRFALLFCSCPQCWLRIREWGYDLVVVLFEFLDDDTKLAQSCTEWLYVQHWYTCRPRPHDARDALGAHGSSARNCHEHMQDTPVYWPHCCESSLVYALGIWDEDH